MAAALRLRRSAREPDARKELLAALEEFGLETEALRFEKSAARFSIAGGSGSGAEQIASLMNESKADAALRAAVRELRAFSANSAKSSSLSVGYEWRSLRSVLQQHGLVDGPLGELDPGDTQSARRWAEYGAACQFLEKREQAIEAFRQTPPW